MQGRSSWIRLIACTISIAQAHGIRVFTALVPPPLIAIPVLKHKSALRRLPPFNTEYRMESQSAGGSSPLKYASRLASIACRSVVVYSLKSNSEMVFGGFVGT